MKDTFERIKARRRAYERFLPILGAFGLATIYSYIRWQDDTITLTMFFITLGLTAIRQAFIFRIHGIAKGAQKYRPQVSKRAFAVSTLMLIAILEGIAILFI